tara:strand:- start:2252 stop:3661 length:1410 start_codon:yes stop_codon:yes gene_type:complete
MFQVIHIEHFANPKFNILHLHTDDYGATMKTPADSPEELELIKKAIKKHGTKSAAAKSLGISRSRLHRVLSWAKSTGTLFSQSGTIKESSEGDQRVVTGKGVRTIHQLVKKANIDLDEWIIVKQVINKWDQMGKDGPTEMWQVKAWLERRPSFWLRPVKTRSVEKKRKRAPRAEKVALIVPDSQHGFRTKSVTDKKTGKIVRKLIPMHSRSACDVVLQIASDLNPDEIVLLGDMVDFGGLSTFPLESDAKYLIQPAMQELSEWLRRLSLTCRERCVWLEGNHELRLFKQLENIQEAAVLRPVDDVLGPPQLSVERLMRLDKLKIDYKKPYGKPYWLFGDIKVHHGHVVRPKGGQTVSSILSGARHSQIVGHIHRREIACNTRTVPDERGNDKYVTISAMSPGTLCSLEPGLVPTGKGRPDQDWQHGLGVVIKDSEGANHMQLIHINDGKCVYNGKMYVGKDDSLIEGDF